MSTKLKFCVECANCSACNKGGAILYSCKESLGTRNIVTGEWVQPSCEHVRTKLCQGRWFRPKTELPKVVSEPKILPDWWHRFLNNFK